MPRNKDPPSRPSLLCLSGIDTLMTTLLCHVPVQIDKRNPQFRYATIIPDCWHNHWATTDSSIKTFPLIISHFSCTNLSVKKPPPKTLIPRPFAGHQDGTTQSGVSILQESLECQSLLSELSDGWPSGNGSKRPIQLQFRNLEGNALMWLRVLMLNESSSPACPRIYSCGTPISQQQSNRKIQHHTRLEIQKTLDSKFRRRMK